MAKAIMVQGTMSSAGKSLICAALCRIFAQDGYRVAPFKSQNMALNSYITSQGLEMGRAQVVQAQAAGIAPSVDMNPILLKPSSDTGSQVIVGGKVVGNMSAKDYFAYKKELVPQIMQAYERLSRNYDIIVLEGAGSPAEINLKENDIVNMGMARMANAPVLLAGDIDRGGVFAALAGTMLLLEESERAYVKGLLINKFRGDPAILAPGLSQIAQITGVPVAGVIPYLAVDIDDEDSLSARLENHKAIGLLDIAVIRFPHISNFTDFTRLASVDGVSVRYVNSLKHLGSPDLVILPGSKNTMGDLLWMRQCGLESAIKKYAATGGLVFGICGGYQMLGRTLDDPERVEHGGSMDGMGLLDIKTIFQPKKVRTQVSGHFCRVEGPFAALSGTAFAGYEIHMGKTALQDGAKALLQTGRTEKNAHNRAADGAVRGNVAGCYVHGVFDADASVQALLAVLCGVKGISPSKLAVINADAYQQAQYDKLAQGVRDHIDMKRIYEILEGGI